MKARLDTNVLVSAGATRGLCADVVREVLVSHELVISSDLLAELETVFQERLGLPEDVISEFLENVQQDATVSPPSTPPDVAVQDKNDLALLSSALNGGADLFVTGDKELLGVGHVRNMEIVSPRGFWRKLKLEPPDSH